MKIFPTLKLYQSGNHIFLSSVNLDVDPNKPEGIEIDVSDDGVDPRTQAVRSEVDHYIGEELLKNVRDEDLVRFLAPEEVVEVQDAPIAVSLEDLGFTELVEAAEDEIEDFEYESGKYDADDLRGMIQESRDKAE